MPGHDGPSSDGSLEFSLTPGQPAYLEVTVDPAAHGPAGLGQVSRGVRVRTTSGQSIQFVFTAQVVP